MTSNAGEIQRIKAARPAAKSLPEIVDRFREILERETAWMAPLAILIAAAFLWSYYQNIFLVLLSVVPFFSGMGLFAAAAILFHFEVTFITLIATVMIFGLKFGLRNLRHQSLHRPRGPFRARRLDVGGADRDSDFFRILTSDFLPASGSRPARPGAGLRHGRHDHRFHVGDSLFAPLRLPEVSVKRARACFMTLLLAWTWAVLIYHAGTLSPPKVSGRIPASATWINKEGIHQLVLEQRRRLWTRAERRGNHKNFAPQTGRRTQHATFLSLSRMDGPPPARTPSHPLFLGHRKVLGSMDARSNVRDFKIGLKEI